MLASLQVPEVDIYLLVSNSLIRFCWWSIVCRIL